MKAGVRYAILERDRFACFYCGRAAPTVILHVDHITPRSGGDDGANNLITACQDCNLGKGARPATDDALQYVCWKHVEKNMDRLKDWRRFHVNFRLPAYDGFITWLANDLPSPFVAPPSEWFEALAAKGTLDTFRWFLRSRRETEASA